MWFLILFLIIGIEEWIRLGYLKSAIDLPMTWPGKIFMGFVSFLLLVAVVFAVSTVFLGITHGLAVAFVGPLQNSFDYNVRIDRKANLVSLGNQTSIEGDFFLGIGSVEGEANYTFVEKIRQGYKLKSVESDQYIIQEKETDNPHIYERIREMKADSLVALFLSQNTFAGYFSQKFIVIPRGSVKHGFSISI